LAALLHLCSGFPPILVRIDSRGFVADRIAAEREAIGLRLIPGREVKTTFAAATRERTRERKALSAFLILTEPRVQIESARLCLNQQRGQKGK